MDFTLGPQAMQYLPHGLAENGLCMSIFSKFVVNSSSFIDADGHCEDEKQSQGLNTGSQ